MALRPGILLINTGSPQSPSPLSAHSYLCRFLTDRRVIGLPAWARFPLVWGLIAPFRAHRSALKYRKVWSEEGPLLRVLSQRLAHRMEQVGGLPVRCGMRYERGSTLKALRELQAAHVDEVTVIPLFPHYARSSYETAVVHVREVAQRSGIDRVFPLYCVEPYYTHPLYLQALAHNIAEGTAAGVDQLIFSFHGIPLSHVAPYKSYPQCDYPTQCASMVEGLLAHPLLAQRALPYEICYQSRLGPHKWLSPTTIGRAVELAREGVHRLAVVCPSFVCDCLETTEEIGDEVRSAFIEAGGEELVLVPCPNDSEATAQALLAIHRDLRRPLREVLPWEM